MIPVVVSLPLLCQCPRQANLHTAYVTDVRGGMNSAFANSRAVVALQNNIYFLKAASYLMQINTIRDAVSPSSHNASQNCLHEPVLTHVPI